MIKRILSVVTGLACGMIIIFLFEILSGKIYSPPPGTNFSDPESVKAMMKNMPTGAFLIILFSYAAGSFAGGLIGSLIRNIQKPDSAILIGGILLVAGIMNLVSLPGHPLWFIISSLLIYLPGSYLGYLSVQKRLQSVN